MLSTRKQYSDLKIALVAGTLLFGLVAHALPRPDAESGRDFRAFAEASYFNTTSNYDASGGSFTELDNGRYYRLIQTQMGGEYYFIPHASLVGQFGFARAESSDGTFTRSRSQPTEVLLGGRYAWAEDYYHLIPEFLFTYPLNRVDVGADDVLTGEGAMQFQAGAWLEAKFGVMVPYGYIGYNYLDGGRASHVAYNIGLAYRPPGWNFAVESFGIQRVGEDENTSLPAVRNALTTQVDGGSMKFYAVNPNFWAARVIGEADLGQSFRLGASFDHTLNGANTARGWTALVRLEYAFGAGRTQHEVEAEYEEAAPVEKIAPHQPEVLQKESPEQKEFVPDTPKYDPSLFEEPKPKPRPKKMVIKPKKKPAKKVDIDKSLEEVQRSLEK